MHTIKLLLTYYLNISVQAANLSDCRIESNRNFLPELECTSGWIARMQVFVYESYIARAPGRDRANSKINDDETA